MTKKQTYLILFGAVLLLLLWYWKKQGATARTLTTTPGAPFATMAGYQAWAAERGITPTAAGFDNYKAGVASGSAAFMPGGGGM